jgi:transcriptional regulator with XRE-family HTH domain
MGEKGIDAMFHAALQAEISKRGRGAQERLAEAVGKTPSHIGKLLKRKTYGSEELRRQIAMNLGYDYESFLDLGRSILRDRGEEVEGPRRAWVVGSACPTVILASEAEGRIEARIEDYYAAPLIDGSIAAGEGAVVFEDEVLSLVWIYAPELHDRRRHNLIAVRISETEGNSMMPTVMPGDIVLIDRDDPGGAAERFRSGAIYAVRDGEGGCAVKRVFLDGDHLVLESDNRAFGPRISWTDSIRDLIIGRVVWGWRNLLEA